MIGERCERAFLGLPSARAWFARQARELLAGRHLMLVTGGQLSVGLLRAGLTDALATLSTTTELMEIDTGEKTTGSSDQGPADRLAHLLRLDPHRLQPGWRASDGDGPIWYAAWLSGREIGGSWLDYFVSAARYGIDPQTMLVLPLPRMPERLAQLAPDTRLAIGSWWGVVSELDTKAVCREIEEQRGTPTAMWREAVVSGLAHGSPFVIERIWEAATASEDALVAALAESARAQGLDAEQVARLCARAPKSSPARSSAAHPPPDWQELWNAGAAQYTEEHGVEITAAAAALIGDSATVRTRIWRAQAPTLLPWLAELRQRVCRVLAERYGTRWLLDRVGTLLREDERQLNQQDPLAIDYWPLEQLVRNADQFGSRFTAVVRRARMLRNRVAHNEPVIWSDFKGLYDAAKGLDLIS